MIRWLVGLLYLGMAICPAIADIDNSAYEAVGVVRNEKERRALQRQFEAERAAEAAREAALEAERQKERHAAAARQAARPYPERLTQQRCTQCHQATNYANQRHTWIGWTLVVKRMVHLNHAPIPAEEHPVIVDYLVETYPAATEEGIVEYGLPLVALALVAGIWWTGQRLMRRWRHQQGIMNS